MNAASPALAHLSRLMWKEYRAQRLLWIVMLAFGIGLQVIFRIALYKETELVVVLSGIGLVMTALFAASSSAISFAGEREERTCDWLLQMACRPGWMLTAKWGFLLLGSFLQVLILTLTALLLELSVGQNYSSKADWIKTVQPTFLVLCCVVLWSILGSLVSRRVVASIPTMFFWWMLTMLGPIACVPWLFGYRSNNVMRDHFQDYVAMACCLVIAAADVWLGWRWAQGKYVDAQLLEQWNLKSTAWIRRLLRREEESRSRIPAGSENPYVGRRAWQRLVWQERHRESYVGLLVWGGCAFAVLLGFFSWMDSTTKMYFVNVLVVPLPLVIGVLGFRYDGEGRPIQFLTHRGISPSAVWLAKHAVWLPRAIGIPLIIWLTGLLAEQVFCGRVQSVPFEMGVSTRHVLLATTSFVRRHLDLTIWYFLLSYGCAHLAAMLLRRVVLSVAVGVMASIFAGWWLALVYFLQIPLWWSVGGIVIWMFAFSRWYAPHWMSESLARGVKVRVAAHLIGAPIVLLTATMVWRAFEVSGFGTSSPLIFAIQHAEFDLSSKKFEAHRDLVSRCQAEIARQSRELTTDEIATIQELSATSMGVFRWRDLSDVEADPVVRQRQFQEINVERVQRILAATQLQNCPLRQLDDELPGETSGLDFNAFESRPRVRVNHHVRLLLETAELQTEAGQLDRALDLYLAALRLTAYQAERGSFTSDWYDAESLQRIILVAVVHWSNHADQSVSRLQSGLERLQQELRLFPSEKEAVVAQYLNIRKWVDILARDPSSYPIPGDFWRVSIVMSRQRRLAHIVCWKRNC